MRKERKVKEREVEAWENELLASSLLSCFSVTGNLERQELQVENP